MRLCRFPALLAIIGLAGCTAFAGKADYADYRVVRMAHDERQRLLAMQRYVQRHPDGWFYQELQTERAGRESAVFESGKSDRRGLEFYLEAYPDGRFAGQARSRLQAMKQVERKRARESNRAKSFRAERRRQEAGLRRTWIRRFSEWWISALLAIEEWGAPLPEVARANAGFSRAFGSQPRPRCSPDECVKSYRNLFAVPIPGGTRVEREVRLHLRLKMREGKLERAELLLPNRGFSRWYELENRSLIVDEDSEDRVRAVEWAFDTLKGLLPGADGGVEPMDGHALAAIEASSLLSLATGGETGPLPPRSASPYPGNALEPSDQTPDRAQNDAQAVFPEQAGTAPDMVMDALQVPVEGTPLAPPEPAPDLVMDALQVSADEGAPGSTLDREAAAGEGGTATQESAGPYRVRAFRGRGLRIVLFASGAGQPLPAYDGVVIEHGPSGRSVE
jgi:hypothetical protein